MPLRNRVTPFNEIVAVPDRGLFMGNRGRLHEDEREPVRQYRVKQWIICRTEFGGRRRTLMTPGEYTELFFLDEATALAAGHRPCGECRRKAFTAFKDAWSRGNAGGEPVAVRDLDARLHEDRWEGWGNYGHPRRHRAELADLPDGAMVAIDGGAFLVLGDLLHRWTPGGYADRRARCTGEAELLTPPGTVAALAAGYEPEIHPSARQVPAPQRSTSRGHVFVVRGDLTKLDCDAWLCPTDVTMRVEPGWGVAAQAPPPEFGSTDRAVPSSEGGSPLPILTNVGGTGIEDEGWYRAGVRAFLDRALATVGDRPRHGREHPLFALPVVGTGEGGARDRRGEMTAAILDELFAWTADHAADVALVCHTERALAAAQAVRRRRADANGERSLWDLEGRLLEQSRRLAAMARQGRLVLFLGAGIGASAGLPTWGELLRQLAGGAGLSEVELAAIERLPSPMDRAAVIQGRMKGSVGAAVAKELEGARHVGMAHALLASLPVTEAATTNYDSLFEQARAQAGRPVAVLPYEAAGDDAGWLLKLHGSVDDPDHIVLTRDDYLSYGAQRSALRGLVQALLITRHMLFVGFSLTDEDFHLIAHDVRQAIGLRRERASRSFGTALTLRADSIAEELWRGDIEFVAGGGDGDSNAAAARRLGIFLDYLLAHAVDNSPHLLDPTYAVLLDDDERDLGYALRVLGRRLPRQSSTAWQPVREFLQARGWTEGDRGE